MNGIVQETQTPPSATDHPLLAKLDKAIRRERRLEGLWRRASKGPWSEEVCEAFEFEAYEDREHARILRRHRSDVARALGIRKRAPGSRVKTIGHTISPAEALAEALTLKAIARNVYASLAPTLLEDRYLRKFVEVLHEAETEGLARLVPVARALGVRPAPRRLPPPGVRELPVHLEASNFPVPAHMALPAHA